MTTKKYFNKANRSGLPVRENLLGYEYPTVKDSGLTEDEYINKYGYLIWTAYGNSQNSNATQSQNQNENTSSLRNWWDSILGNTDNSSISANQATETKDMKTNYIYYILLGIVVVVFVVFLVKFTKK